MKTIIIKGTNWFKNVEAVNTDMSELNAAIEICFKKDMDRFRKLNAWDKPKRLVELARKYPHHTIA